MNRILIMWVSFAILIIALVNISTTASDTNYNNLYQTSGGQPVSSSSSGSTAAARTTYVIVDGPGAGTQLSTTVDPNTRKPTSAPKANGITKAEGHIGGIGVGEGMNCPGPLGHYHGTLRGQPDPAPEACGWGHVSVLSETSDGTMSISNNYTTEVSIINFIEMEPPDYDSAANAADNGAISLGLLQHDIRDPSKNMIGAGMAHKVSDQLGKAINADKFVDMILTPLPPKRDTEKDAAITLKINNALMAKQEALMILLDAEAMAAAMGK